MRLFALLAAAAAAATASPQQPVSPQQSFRDSDPVDVFTAGEGGYYCIKIPDLLLTANSTLLALGEGRWDSCSDYAKTDLVFKRSLDGGATWSKLQVLHSEGTLADQVVIGNAAPVQVRETGRILVPFDRNNAEVWLTYSDDDGQTWAPPQNITDTAAEDNWKWIGMGPPGGIQLASGRVLVPGYHTTLLHGDGGLANAHALLSDNGGADWYVGATWGNGTRFWPSECQAVELSPDYVFVNARAVLTYRLGAWSHDGGRTWSDMEVLESLPAPLDGCEGSTVMHADSGRLLYTGPSAEPTPYRSHLALFTSTDDGHTWVLDHVIDSGPSAYSAMAPMPDGSVKVLYERADDPVLVFVPSRISIVTLTPSS